jgi:ribonuclease P protein component
MIPRKFRLSGRKNIENLRSVGKFLQSSSFGLFYNDNQNTDNPRFCIVVSKKISTKANIRNKVKRMVRFSIMQLAGKVKRGYDLMFLMKGSVLKLDTLSFKKELEDILIHEGII